MKKFLPLALIIFLAACNNDERQVDPPAISNGIAAPAVVKVNRVNSFKHDSTSYTEGLEIHNGKVYESAGDYEHSALQVSELKTGKVLDQFKMGKPETDNGGIFAEGISILKGKIYQLTWNNHIVYVYDEKDIHKVVRTFNWSFPGWGMTNDGTNLIISDGRAEGYLYYVNPDSFNIVKSVIVQDNNGPVANLNELEYINGFVYANVFTTDKILKIDPATGNVLKVIDCTGLMMNGEVADRTGNNVLNGIAYDSSTKKVYITGKRWPAMFELKLQDVE